MSSTFFRVGLTGGIGSGKTAVSDRLAALGATVIDTDRIAHALTAAHGAAMPAIEAAFGPDFLTADGALDRAAMRSAVFSDDAAKARLEAIMHPLILAECERAARHADGAYLVYVVPLLLENGRWRERVDRILVVDCAPATQVARVVARSALTPAMVEAIMARQVTRAQRLAQADDVLINDGQDLDALYAEVDLLHERYATCALRRTTMPR